MGTDSSSASSKALQELVAQFERLPGIGRKSAERLAYHVLREPKADALKLAEAIRSVKSSVRSCKICFHVTEKEICGVCDDATRDRTIICVVEQPRDLAAIEESGVYRGLYHVLHGAFAPLDGVSPEDLTVDRLMDRLRPADGPSRVDEVILATNPNFEGEGTALLLRQRLATLERAVKVTRIARGVPSGSHLEYVGRNSVADALEGRRELR